MRGGDELTRQVRELEGFEEALLRRQPAVRLQIDLVVRPRLASMRQG
jgi:hypothetical protein